MKEEKNTQLDGLLKKAAAEKYGIGPIVEDVAKIHDVAEKIDSLVADVEAMKPVVEQVKVLKESIKGDPGYSPVLGQDYLTEEEQQRIVDALRPKKGVDYFDGEPGKTPTRGEDYLSDQELKQIKEELKPVKGKDYFLAEEVQEFKESITPQKGKDYVDGKDADPIRVIEAIKALKGEDAKRFSQVVGSQIDISHVRNASSFIFNGTKYGVEELMHGGGSSSGGSGTVTSISVASSHGLAGSSDGNPATPTITLSTTVTGIVKGDGTAFSAAVANTDYQIPIILTTTGTSGAATFNGTTLNIPNYTSGGGGTVDSVVGTANRITVDSTDPANPIVNIAATYVGQSSITTLGTIGTGTWNATTISVAKGGTGVTTIAAKSIWLANVADTVTSVTPGAGQSIRINAGNTAWEAYTPSTGTVTSVSGTTNRISSTGGATPVIDIAAAYVGQTSITTLGTVATGTWNATVIADGKIATALTGKTYNGLTITSSTGTLTIAALKIVTVSNTLTFTGTDGSSVAFGAGGTVLYGNQTITLSGDVSGSGATSITTTLATVNSNVGTFGSATQASVVTVNGKGLVTAASQTTVTPAVGSITGLGTGVATFLATPSSANLLSALTDETGTGVAVFNNKPTFLGTIQTITAVAALALDGSLGNIFTKTIASPSTFTQSNFSTGQNFMVTISGAQTITWFAGVTWFTVGATAPTQAALTTYGFTCTGINTFNGYLVGTQ